MSLILSCCVYRYVDQEDVKVPESFAVYTKFLAGSWWLYQKEDDPSGYRSYLNDKRTFIMVTVRMNVSIMKSFWRMGFEYD